MCGPQIARAVQDFDLSARLDVGQLAGRPEAAQGGAGCVHPEGGEIGHGLGGR